MPSNNSSIVRFTRMTTFPNVMRPFVRGRYLPSCAGAAEHQDRVNQRTAAGGKKELKREEILHAGVFLDEVQRVNEVPQSQKVHGVFIVCT